MTHKPIVSAEVALARSLLCKYVRYIIIWKPLCVRKCVYVRYSPPPNVSMTICMHHPGLLCGNIFQL